jgi:hypothetical protein
MSTSPTSKPASSSSPETGTAIPSSEPAPPERAASATGAVGERAAKPDARDPRRGRTPGDTLEVELIGSRQRSVGWVIGGIAVGIILITHLGTVGVWGGYALLAWGAVHALLLVRSFVWPVGTIVVTEREVSLPRGPHRGRPVVIKPADVTAVYLLRKSVPWNKAAPVLVVELGSRALLFPRDWFATEADQRHIVHALLRD